MTSKRPAHVSWIQWQVYGLQDLRSEILYALFNGGIPALAVMPISELPGLISGAEYRSKMPFLSAPLFVLEQAEHDAQLWLD